MHHTACGGGFLADDDFRRQVAVRVGRDQEELAAAAVTDPTETVRADVARLIDSPALPARASVSGHVYDLETGLVTKIVAPIAVPAVG
jgi:carbonic anhydrase